MHETFCKDHVYAKLTNEGMKRHAWSGFGKGYDVWNYRRRKIDWKEIK